MLRQVKGDLLTLRDSAATKAVKYDSWLASQAGTADGREHVLMNHFHAIPISFLPKVRSCTYNILHSSNRLLRL